MGNHHSSHRLTPTRLDDGGPEGLRDMSAYIDSRGLVRYKEIMNDPSVLLHNAHAVNTHDGASLQGKDNPDALAFLMNAYNVLAMHLAARKMLKHELRWEGNVSMMAKAKFFYGTTVKVAGEDTNLLKLESRIREQFKDPRIHFAINCMSWSCPRLPRDLFEGSTVDAKLEELAVDFVTKQGGADFVQPNKLVLSSIFKWYAKDFREHSGSLEKFLQGVYAKAPKDDARDIPDSCDISFADYDWTVNNSKE